MDIVNQLNNYIATQWRVIASVVLFTLFVFYLRHLIKGVVNKKVHDYQSKYRIRKTIDILFYLVLVLILFNALLGEGAKFAVPLGVFSAGVAFALQEVILSFAGWIGISFGSFYKVGDRILIGNTKGDVMDVGMLRTTLMECGQWVSGDLYNGRIVRVPNSFIYKEHVYNYTTDFPFLWDEIKVFVRYGSDVDFVTQQLKETLDHVTASYAKEANEIWKTMTNKYMIEDASTEPKISLMATDNWMEFTLRYTVDYRKRRSTNDVIFREILKRSNANMDKFALGSATFEITALPEVKVRTLTEN